ncbi:MAG: AI-2E family transporter [Planctomycetota bacterium]|nr:AI-2E family transporter [Planctomycetota bacterium]
MPNNPRDLIRAWLPHLALLGLLGLGCLLLVRVFAPLTEPILLAAAIALLTGPFIYAPIDSLLTRLAPQLSPPIRRHIASILATTCIATLCLLPVILLLVTTMGGLGSTIDLMIGVITKDDTQLGLLETRLTAEVANINELYPRLNLSRLDIPAQVRSAVEEAFSIGGAFLSFLSAGTGVLAHLVLSLIALTVFYAEGSRMSAALLRFSPLTPEQQGQLERRYRAIMLRLINDTFATALAKGLALAGVAWGVDHVLGTGLLPFVPLAILATVISLLPVVGATMVWLPLAGLQWGLGQIPAAIAIALGCTVANYLVGYLHRRLSRHIDDRETWMGFLLFLGLVGGLMSFGFKGFVIGPMAVVFVHTIASFWGPMYGLGPKDETLDDAEGDAATPTPASDTKTNSAADITNTPG